MDAAVVVEAQAEQRLGLKNMFEAAAQGLALGLTRFAAGEGGQQAPAARRDQQQGCQGGQKRKRLGRKTDGGRQTHGDHDDGARGPERPLPRASKNQGRQHWRDRPDRERAGQAAGQGHGQGHRDRPGGDQGQAKRVRRIAPKGLADEGRQEGEGEASLDKAAGRKRASAGCDQQPRHAQAPGQMPDSRRPAAGGRGRALIGRRCRVQDRWAWVLKSETANSLESRLSNRVSRGEGPCGQAPAPVRRNGRFR